MASSSSTVDVLTTIARSMVVSHEYASVEEALQHIALSEVRRRTAYYQRRIQTLERKHNADFQTFSARLQGRATPAEEDDWLAWRSANRMLADWQKTYDKLSAQAVN